LPTGKELDAVSPDNPVLLRHASGHAIFVNEKALELAGIGPNTPNPPGGQIVRDKSGRAIGMLRDDAMDAVYAVLAKTRAAESPAEKQKRLLEYVNLATRDALENGVTTWQDMGEPFNVIDFYKEIAAAGKLHLRLYAWINGESVDALKAHLKDYYLVGYGKDGFLTVRGVGEILSDGALGTHSAWFFKPYLDVPSTSGYNVTPIKEIKAMAEVAIADGFQMSVRSAEPISGSDGRAPGRYGSPVANRPCPTSDPLGYSALPRPACNRLNADGSRLRRRALRGEAHWGGARRVFLCLALADRQSRHHR
jgi:predicted amidohydrolase YtcJ